jgi:small-conductance mechanosensitive channel
MISRLRSNNNLFAVRPKMDTKMKPGRTRIYGDKLGTASSLAGENRDLAQAYKVNLYGQSRSVLAYDQIVMLKTLKRMVRVVWIYRKSRRIALFSTDLTLSVTEIIEYYGARWKIEACFKELKREIGSAETQTRNSVAVTNHLEFCMMATSLIWIYACRLANTPSRRHAVHGRDHFAFSDVRRILTRAALDDNFALLCPPPGKSIDNSFVAAFVIELFFRWYSRPFRGRMTLADPVLLNSKIGRLILGAIIDGMSTLIFIAAVILCFYLFFEKTDAVRVLVATYLSAIVAVRIVRIIARFFLAPKDPSSRFLPMTTPMALYLYRWITAISVFASFGFLTCGIIRLAGASEAAHIKSIFMVSFVIFVLLIVMILQKRKEVAEMLSAIFPAQGLWAKLMHKWHHFAVFFVFLLLLLSMGNQLMGDSGSYLGIKTLLLIPLYFLVDWILRQILDVLFGFILKKEDTFGTEEIQNDVGTEAPEVSPKTVITRQVDFNRMKEIIFSSLRISLSALFILWALHIWGIELPIGKAVVKAVINILVVVLLCYVFWEFLNTAIQRRLSREMPDGDEEMEEGGAGGSRIGTLLVLFRKFLMVFILVIAVMVILSAMGVDIGPLIAGAGIFGLAIGFGAQTLVKDIIAGVFFLMDDAFRVGDYIQSGSSKGTVERISLRSLSLRHPRGMVNTVPFGDIAAVTNFSRDYIITKLDFRVRYDTDVEKVRKLIKNKVYQPIFENEDLSPKLLGKIKSQGVRQMDDSAMIMRVKYKTKPGNQFIIRKEVYRLLQEAFKTEGIEFAHKNVTVYIPPASSQLSGLEKQKIIEAGAAAAVSDEQTNEETENLAT